MTATTMLPAAPRAGALPRTGPPEPRWRGFRGTERVRRAVLVALPAVLLGYLFFDQPFAWLHVPKTPFFLGEMVLALGALLAMLATPHFTVVLRHSLPAGLLVAFVAWGMARTVPYVSAYGIFAIRDASLWYYGLAAILSAALIRGLPELSVQWARRFSLLVVPLLLWTPISLVVARLGGPLIPDSDVQLFTHRPGNALVVVATVVAFIWLVPSPSIKPRSRALLTGVGALAILAMGTQNRGGLVAAAAALVLAALLVPGRRLRMPAVMVTTVLLGLVLAWGLNIRVGVGESREVSVDQLLQNVTSIAQGDQAPGQLGNNVQFRDALWSGTVNLAAERGALLHGVGFGPNLAQELGASNGAAGSIRSPHNSHVDVLARMGVIGLALWLCFWLSWYFVLARGLRRRADPLSPLHAGIVKVCIVGATAVLINAYFDPTLETPQVALWLWTLVGIGLGMTAKPSRFSIRRVN